MSYSKLSDQNENYLRLNRYPGRGIIIGKSPDKKSIFQVYWIMGRSENSRNRIFERKDDFVRTKAFNEELMTDPSLIIYYPIKNFERIHIVSNGDQTDTIFEALEKGETFEDAINLRTFEPDTPHFTPRISGIVDLENNSDGYKIAIIKAFNNIPEYCQRLFFNYEKSIPGYGHCIHTYEADGDPLPSYKGEPFLVKMFDTTSENIEYYWSLLDGENKVSLLIKQINLENKNVDIRIVNKNI